MGRFIDLAGMRFGRLTVIRRNGTVERGIKNKVKAPTWECRCDCGNTVTVVGHELRAGDTSSCGCLHKEVVGNLSKSHGDGTKKSDYHRLYHIWFSMKQRCENPKDTAFQNYGARGIFVCEEWHDYEAFKTWAIQHGYSDTLTIDRIDNDGGYSPDNCRWADDFVQANNRRRCRYVEIGGVRKTITEWCRIYGVNMFTAFSRIDRFHWDPVDAVTTPATRKTYDRRKIIKEEHG